MPTYHYKCSNCSRTYLEHRDVTHPQSFTHCEFCNAPFEEYIPE